LCVTIRNKYKINLQQWLIANEKWLHEHEINHVQRLIDYLDVVKTPHSNAAKQVILQKDFKKFYLQYDQRRNKNFEETFTALSEWYANI